MWYHYVAEPSDEGGYTVFIRWLPGCTSEGDTLDEAVANLREAAALHLDCSVDEIELRPDGGRHAETESDLWAWVRRRSGRAKGHRKRRSTWLPSENGNCEMCGMPHFVHRGDACPTADQARPQAERIARWFRATDSVLDLVRSARAHLKEAKRLRRKRLSGVTEEEIATAEQLVSTAEELHRLAIERADRDASDQDNKRVDNERLAGPGMMSGG